MIKTHFASIGFREVNVVLKVDHDEAMEDQDKMRATIISEMAQDKEQITTLKERIKELETKYENHDKEWIESKLYFDVLADNTALREALENIVLWAKGSTCEICGEKKMTDTDAYDYAKAALEQKEFDKNSLFDGITDWQKEKTIIPNYEPIIMDRECETNGTMEDTTDDRERQEE